MRNAWRLLELFAAALAATLVYPLGSELSGGAVAAAWPWVCSAALAGYATLWLRRAGFPAEFPARGGETRWLMATSLLAAAFAATFAVLPILQYQALLVPHGDSGMYEEHLWNFWHGKGFRSQLDGGRSFLGEHLEVVHLLLSPAYLLWPGLPILNVCQALGLASGAFAIHLLGRRWGLAPAVCCAAAAAYLCYFPLQNLAHEPTWKTFRPETLGVPLLLFGLLALESGRLRTMACCYFLAFLAKEEFAIAAAATAPALWFRGRRGPAVWTAVLSVLYLALALGVAIPHFRAGEPPHYTPYFKSLGDRPGAILRRVLTDPAEVWRRLAAPDARAFLALMLAPWCFLPLLAPVRLLAAAPIFGYLMLADRPELRQPWFHFHAPLVPLLAWAFVAGLARLPRTWPPRVATFAALFGLFLSAWFGRGPLTWQFHDPRHAPPVADGRFEPRGSYWRSLYMPGARAGDFDAAFAAVPSADRVAATDYVRTRFNHHAAAHDYPLRSHVRIGDIDAFVLDKTEGWWGRDPATNPDHGLLAALAANAPAGTEVMVRGARFAVVRHTPYFLVLRRAPIK